MDLETFRSLSGAEGAPVLAAAERAYAEHDGEPVRCAQAVAKAVTASPALRAAALSTVSLRLRAEAKFGEDAARMWFTPDALEQSSRRSVADHRAARLALAEPASVVDLGCGIGADLIAFARAGLVVAGVDLDPVRVAMAEANLAVLGLGGAAMVADVADVDLGAFGAAYADPARRTGAGRTFRPQDWSPSWEFVEHLLRGTGVVKTAPGLPHDLVPEGVEAEWVSDRGDLKEAVLWSPGLAAALRRATVIGRGGLATVTDEDDPYQGADRPVRALGEFLYEPDDAVIRAGLVTAVAAGVQGGLLDQRIAYVTGDAAYRSPFARSYRMLEELPFKEKPLKAALRERGIGVLAIKKRGVDVSPEQLRRRLDLQGEREATLVLTRVGDARRAFLVEPF